MCCQDREQTYPVSSVCKRTETRVSLSPNLFNMNIYVNDLFSRLFNANSNPLSLNQISVSALMYADDLVILSTTQEGLQKCLNELYKYCIEWKLDVNIDKTKCMEFMKISKLHNQQIWRQYH